MPRGGARPNSGGRREGAGRPLGSQNERTRTIHQRLEAVREMFAKIVPDEQLIKAIWVRAIAGDAACLRLCAEYSWGKVREAADLKVEETVRGDVVYKCIIPRRPPRDWSPPAADPEKDASVPTRS